jgi:anaerobic C4-dicarboxylate transporter DcuA
MFLGKDLKDDPEYQARVKAGAIPPAKTAAEGPPLAPGAKLSAYIFLLAVSLVVVFGFFPELRRLPGAKDPLAMSLVIELVMLSVAAIMLLVTKVSVDDVPKTPTLRAGVVAVIGIFGLAWLGDSYIAANRDIIVPAIGEMTRAAPWTFTLGLFFASVLLYTRRRPPAHGCRWASPSASRRSS